MYTFEQSLLIAIPGFSLLILLEFLYGRWRKRDAYAHISDVISSLCSGLTFIVSNTIGFGVLVFTYDWVHQNFAQGEISASSWWVWPLAFVVKDFTSYWVHRWAHANSFLWSMHLVHHSSEQFNLPVALRQNAFKWLDYGNLLMLPLAIAGVPVEVMAIIYPIHYFLQYWYHTPHIGKLGLLEYIIVTPAQHRVHHAINDVYIDKNFASIFCWDRLFGTFQQELDEEPPVYGCLGPVRTWDPMKIELNYIGRLLRDAFYTKHWGDKVRVFASRTGWRPEDVKARWPGAYIENYRDFERFKPSVPRWLEWAGFLEMSIVAAGGALYLFANMATIAPNAPWLFSYVAIILFGINGLAAVLEGRSGVLGGSVRFAIVGFWLVTSGGLFAMPQWLALSVAGYFALSFAFTAVRWRHITVNGAQLTEAAGRSDQAGQGTSLA